MRKYCYLTEIDGFSLSVAKLKIKRNCVLLKKFINYNK